MKVVLLMSNNLRHKYIAHCLAEAMDLALVVAEMKSKSITDTSTLPEEDAVFIKNHFRAREESEEKYFGDFQNFPEGTPLLQMSHGSINSEEIIKTIEIVSPEIILLFGTSIIKGKLLQNYPRQIINFHLGLSPYYRGSATNLFPYYYREPECVGATIHLATPEVDRGEILHQFRPEITEKDSLHDIGNKVILEGGKVLPKILKKYKAGQLQPVVQKGSGKVCRNKDLTPDLLRGIYENFEEGMIDEYIKNKKFRDQQTPIIS